MEYSFLFELDSSRDDWMIRVRLCRMWDSINTKKSGELISLDMILIDEKETLIHATVRKNQANRFRCLLREGFVFAIKNFKVLASVGNYRPIQNDYKIVFLATTSLKRLDEGSVEIPINGFQFISLELIESRVNDVTVLSDVVGCLCGIGDVETIGTGRKKRDIEIVTDYSMTTKITLWGELGETFDPNLYNKDGGPFIVIVTSTSVKKFQGKVSFSATTASKIYVNLQTEYVASLIQRFSTVSVGVQAIESSNVNNISPEEEMFVNRMSIKELLETEWNAEIQEYIVTVRAKITEIDNIFGWYYISCNSCSKKVVADDGVYTCNTCNKECKFPLVKFKIHIKVKDEAGESTFVLFNAVAEKFLDTSAQKLFNRLPSNSSDVPIQIKNLCGKDFIFKLRLNNYNLKEGRENYTVSKLFIPDDKLELEYKLGKDKKGKNVMEDENQLKMQMVEGFSIEKEPADVSSNYLEDSEGDDHVVNGVKNRKRRNIILDNDEFSDGESNQYKKQIV